MSVESGAAANGARSRSGRFKEPKWLRYLVVALALAPLAWAAYALASDAFSNTRLLGSEPVKESEHFTGKWALRFLLATLTVSPAMAATGWGWLIRYRRIFGLVAFAYVCAHLTIYFAIDIELMWSLLVEDVLDRTYITLGMIAFVGLIPLALTSTKASIRRLGSKRWTAIHRVVYLSTILACIHFYMAVKRDIREPLFFFLIAAVLFAYRIGRARQRRSSKSVP